MAEKAEILITARDATRAAFAQAQRGLEGLQASAAGIAARLAPVAAGIAAIGTAVSALRFREVIDLTDGLNDLSERTGIAVERLSELRYAGLQSDASMEDLGAALRKLSQNMAAAAGGNKDAQATFAAIGVSVTDATGKLRSADQVLEDIAERFASYEDGAAKSALATELFSRSGQQLIPFLNNGRAGLQALSKEARELGVVFSGDLAKQAAAFNDNMERLKQLSTGVSASLTSELLPALNTFLERLVRGRQEFGSFLELSKAGASGGLFELPAAVLSRDELVERLSQRQTALAAAEADLERYRRSDSLFAKSQAGFAAERVKAMQLEVQQLQRLQRVYEPPVQSGDPMNWGNEARGAQGKSGEKVQAPIIPGSKPAGTETQDALAEARKRLDGQLRAIADALAQERDQLRFHEQIQLRQYEQGEISLKAYYSERTEAQRQFLERTLQGFEQERQAAQRFADESAKAGKPADKVDAQSRLDDIARRRDTFLREQEQAVQLSSLEQADAFRQVEASVEALQLQIQELIGNGYAAELARIGGDVAAARRTLVQGGKSAEDVEAIATAYGNALRNAAQFAELQRSSGDAIERSRNAEELFLIQAQRSGATRAEIEQRLGEIRRAGVADLDAQLVSMRQLVAASEQLNNGAADPRLLAFYEQLRIARERAFDAQDPGLQRFNEQAEAAGDRIAQGFEDAVLSGQKLRDVVNALGDDLARLIFRDLITEPLADGISGAIKGIGKDGQGGGFERFFSGIVGGITGGGDAGAGATKVAADTSAATAATTLATALAASTSAATASAAAEGVATTSITAMSAAVAAATSALSALAAAASSAAAAEGSATAGETIAGLFHAGGVVGQGGGSRVVALGAFAGATRYHSGGIAGLAPDEVPAILRRGEEVLTQADPRHRDNGGGPAKVIQLNVNVQATPGMSRESAQQQGVRIGRGIQRSMARSA